MHKGPPGAGSLTDSRTLHSAEVQAVQAMLLLVCSEMQQHDRRTADVFDLFLLKPSPLSPLESRVEIVTLEFAGPGHGMTSSNLSTERLRITDDGEAQRTAILRQGGTMGTCPI